MISTQLELPSRERFTEQDLDDSCSNRVEHGINSTNFSTVNPWATLDHPHTMSKEGESLEEHDNARRFGETRRENRHEHAKTSDSSDHPRTMRQGEKSLEERDNARRFGETRREKTENLDFRTHSIKTNHAIAENSTKHKHAKSIDNSDHPHNTRHGGGSSSSRVAEIHPGSLAWDVDNISLVRRVFLV